MKHQHGSFGTAGITLVSVLLWFTAVDARNAQAILDGYETPSENQQKIIDSLVTDLGHQRALIEEHFSDLITMAMIREDGTTEIPFAPFIRDEVGRRERHLINESAMIKWKDQSIEEVTFQQRKGLIGSGQIVKREIKYRVTASQTEATDVSLDFVVSELADGSRWERVNFRLPTTSAGERDHKETVEVRGMRQEMDVIYIRNIEVRIEILRENVRLTKDLRRRIEWLVSHEAQNRRSSIGKYLTF